MGIGGGMAERKAERDSTRMSRSIFVEKDFKESGRNFKKK
jgi:hypothetical protein